MLAAAFGAALRVALAEGAERELDAQAAPSRDNTASAARPRRLGHTRHLILREVDW